MRPLDSMERWGCSDRGRGPANVRARGMHGSSTEERRRSRVEQQQRSIDPAADVNCHRRPYSSNQSDSQLYVMPVGALPACQQLRCARDRSGGRPTHAGTKHAWYIRAWRHGCWDGTPTEEASIRQQRGSTSSPPLLHYRPAGPTPARAVTTAQARAPGWG
jgi:hypothetical protein